MLWKQKANQAFNQTERNFYKRDFELMSKRRYAKVLQAMQMERDHGFSITKMPEEIKNFKISKKNENKK